MKRLWNITIAVLAALVAAGMLVSAYGGTIDPRTFAYPGLATLALPVVMVVAVAALVVSLLLRHRVASLIVGISILLSMPSIHTVFPMSWNSQPDDESRSFTVLSWNVAGFRSDAMRHVLAADADLVLLQEASIDNEMYLTFHNPQPLIDSLTTRYPYHTEGCSDVVILSKVPFTLVPDTTMRNMRGMFSDRSYHTFGRVYDLKIKGENLRIVSVHMQSIGLKIEDKKLYKDIATFNRKVNTKQELRDVKHSLTDKLTGSFRRRAGEAHTVRDIIDAAPGNVIVCGDFNDTPGSYCYRTIRGDDMSDAFVDCGTLPINTFNRDGLYFKIDHVLYRGDIKAVATRREKWKASDHYPQITTFEWTARKTDE